MQKYLLLVQFKFIWSLPGLEQEHVSSLHSVPLEQDLGLEQEQEQESELHDLSV